MQTYSSALWRTIFSFSRAERSKEINRIDAAAHYWSLAKGCFSSSYSLSFQGFPLWTVWAARLIYAHIFICISSCRLVLMFIKLWFICTLGLHSVADFSCSLIKVSVAHRTIAPGYLECNDWCPTRYNPFFHYLIL